MWLEVNRFLTLEIRELLAERRMEKKSQELCEK